MEKSRRRINLSFYSVEYFVYSIMIAPTENEGNRVLVFILAVWYWCVFVNVCAWVKSRILSGYLLQRRNFKLGTVLQSDFIFYLTKQVVLKTENNIKEIPTKVHSEKVKLIRCGCVQNHFYDSRNWAKHLLLRRDGLLTLMVLWGEMRI